MRDFIWCMAAMFFVIGCFVVVIRVVDSYECASYSEVTGRETEYVFLTCYVKTERGFVPESEFKARAVTNE